MKSNITSILFTTVCLILMSSACSDPEPDSESVLPKPVLYYNTHDSMRMIDFDNNTYTVDYDANSDNLFGLTRIPQSNDYIQCDNSSGIWRIAPKYSDLDFNENYFIDFISQPTDLQFADNGDTYLAASFGVHKMNSIEIGQTSSSNIVQIQAPILVFSPFSIALKGNRYLFVAGVDKLQITDLVTNNSKEILGVGLEMAAYMDFDSQGNLYINDAGTDSVLKIDNASISLLISNVNNSDQSTIIPQVLSQGGLLADPNNDNVRGPIGISCSGSKIYISVDMGMNIPGQIIELDSGLGTQTLYESNVPGPRAIVAI